VPGPDPATAAIRHAVRDVLTPSAAGATVLVACSGGADSLALAVAAAFEAPRLALRAGAVVVDHGLQRDSAAVAAMVGGWLSALGLAPVDVVRVEVAPSGEGVEAAARRARYAALDDAAERHDAVAVLLGHTLDDQAEQVLLGLTRGAGARSLSGMPSARGRVLRPLLGITRRQTRQSLDAQDIPWWEDPMNEDPAYLRVRARRALAELDRDLGPGIAAALARSAGQLRDDADLLDALADDALAALLAGSRGSGAVEGSSMTSRADDVGVVVGTDRIAAVPRALRTRVWRRLLIAAGAPAGAVSTRHTDACDLLVTDWHGQGPAHVPGGLLVARSGPRVTIGPPTRVEWTQTGPTRTATESQE
jgi:tRNA(Ile)-lysidine synthase